MEPVGSSPSPQEAATDECHPELDEFNVYLLALFSLMSSHIPMCATCPASLFLI
jgi:hypothetical protein